MEPEQKQRFLVRKWRTDGGDILGYIQVPRRSNTQVTLLDAGLLAKEALSMRVCLEWWESATDEQKLIAEEASPEDKATALALGDVTKQGLLQRGGKA